MVRMPPFSALSNKSEWAWQAVHEIGGDLRASISARAAESIVRVREWTKVGGSVYDA